MPKNKEGLTKKASMGPSENGEWVVRYYYVDEKNAQQGDSEEMSAEDMAKLSPAEKQRLGNAGATIDLPGE